MRYRDFVKFYQTDLFELWDNWIPIKKDIETMEVLKEKAYFIEDDDEEFGFYELIDYGDRVLSFDNFMLCAYDNTIP